MAGMNGNPRGEQAVSVSAAFTGIAVVIVALRLYTRMFLVRCLGPEDYGIVLAVVSYNTLSLLIWCRCLTIV